MNKNNIKLKNYFDLLIDKNIDDRTKCPICISCISDILNRIYLDLKKNIKEGEFQRFLKENSLFGLYHWKENYYPILLIKLKKLLLMWKEVCNKSLNESNNLYENIYEKTTFLKAGKSPVNIKAIKYLDSKLVYILGIIYADGSLRDIWLTQKKEKRFRWEITITDESYQNLQKIVQLLEEIFNIKTNVKSVYGGRWYRILFNSLILHRILNKIFEMPMGYKKGKLKIPTVIKKASFDIKRYFLVGFFDGDGMCSRFNKKKKFTPVISVSQSSKEILQDLNEILKEKGFNFRLNQKKRNKFEWYVLETKDKEQIKRFQEEFGFMYHNKKERLKLLVESFNT